MDAITEHIEQQHGKQEVQQQTVWGAVEAAILKHHHKPDLEAARILYSAVAAHSLEGAPVWPMLVGPPGSMKTELLNGMDGLQNVHFIDQLTAKTFISGQIDDGTVKRTASPSLLHRIGKSGIIAYPDFSTILAMKDDAKASVLADLRRIYDGKLAKQFGTAEDPKQHMWEGRLTCVVAVTPEIDRYYSIFQSLGERFVMVRWPRAGGIDAALAAMNQDNKQAKQDIRVAVHHLLTTLPQVQPTLADDLQMKIGALTEVTVRGRTHVPRSGYDKHIIYVPEAESSTRLAQQLAQLAKGSALLGQRNEVDESDLRLVRRAAFDCIPPLRKVLLEAAMYRRNLKTLTIPRSTLHYVMEDMELQGLLEGDRLTDLAAEMLALAGFTLGEEVAA
jgi:hypothetical protein